MVKRYHVIVEGRVQGVGFRSFCILQAQKRGLTGSVRNMSNGMVEIFVQGDEKQVDSFLKKVKEGDRFILVEDMSIKECPVEENEKSFDRLLDKDEKETFLRLVKKLRYGLENN